MALYPAAKHRLIAPGASDPRITPRIGILHVDAGNAASLFNWFNGPSGGVESHFHSPKVGKLEQYRDTGFEADANFLANPFAISVETQGLGEGEWNDKQLDDIKGLILWCREEHGIPLKECKAWNGKGWGYHTKFPEWSNVKGKTCPGKDRIAQYYELILPWMKEVDDDMFTPADQKRLAALEVTVKEIQEELEKSNRRQYRRDKKILDAIESLKP